MVRFEPEKNLKNKAEEKAKLKAEEKARRKAQKKARREAKEKSRFEEKEKTRLKAEEKARHKAKQEARFKKLKKKLHWKMKKCWIWRMTVRNRKFLRKFTPFNLSTDILNQYPNQINPNISSSETHQTATPNSEGQDLISNSEAFSTNVSPPASTPTTSSDATATTCNDGGSTVQSTAQIPLRRSTRARRPNILLKDFVT